MITYTVEKYDPFTPCYNLRGVAATLPSVAAILADEGESIEQIGLESMKTAFGKADQFDTGNYLVTRWQIRGAQ